MKYILKKDLPFAKAGKIISIKNSKLRVPLDEAYNLADRENEYIFDISDILGLREHGWIEEVKPREYEVYLNVSDIPIGIKFKGNTTVWGSTTNKIIKVREVIET